ncbi:hypothetical protein [Bailinhaonella thermotolerans]|uniref:FtsK domain-containing protein n=1 Tax=Bailinhaonella thermotolerans TaxID=1070861 RepID=A0A3A4ALH2_9ACTN|nr:hypothetical protein [Bailinhaonella thermotolerans]RJL22021.1 hypothetical protein D5H75_36070 [Bailinhaonella thermotolerans]
MRQPSTSAELVPVQPTPPRPSLARRLLRWAAPYAWRLLLWLFRRLWATRDTHLPLWLALALYGAAVAVHAAVVPWWLVLLLGGALTAAARTVLARRAIADPDLVTGVIGLAVAWLAAAVTWGPFTLGVSAAWAVLTLAVLVMWLMHPQARRWRVTRGRIRNWTAALPAVLAALGMAGVVVVAIAQDEAGRMLIRLRLPVTVTRTKLDKAREAITSGMHWPQNSIREVRQDGDHNSAARVVLVWQDGTLKARHVTYDPATAPTSLRDPIWLGKGDNGQDAAIPLYAVEGLTRGLYGGEPGSAKSNLLRLLAAQLAHCPDALIWVIDLKNEGLTFAPLLPRIDWIATDRTEATRMLQAAAVGIPLRARLLRPEHNQKLPITVEHPGVVIVFDEFGPLLGKKAANAAAVEAAKTVFSQGRATNWGAEIASQYLSQTSLHPDLRPLFPRGIAGRTTQRADSQFVLKNWTRVDTTLLPTGAFYVQLPSQPAPSLLHTPEVTDTLLAQIAAATADRAPVLEAPTAAELPHYADRWTRLPAHLLPYCSPEQAAAQACPALAVEQPRLLKAVAADDHRPVRLVVTETIPTGAEEISSVQDIREAVVRTLADAWTRSPEWTTGALLKEVGGSRQSLAVRLRAWSTLGILDQPRRGEWRRLIEAEEVPAAAQEAEEYIRAQRAATRHGGSPDLVIYSSGQLHHQADLAPAPESAAGEGPQGGAR